MGDQTIAELQQLLEAGDNDVGFLAYLPDATGETLLRASREKLEAEETALGQAITEAVQALPAPLGRIAQSVLG